MSYMCGFKIINLYCSLTFTIFSNKTTRTSAVVWTICIDTFSSILAWFRYALIPVHAICVFTYIHFHNTFTIIYFACDVCHIIKLIYTWWFIHKMKAVIITSSGTWVWVNWFKSIITRLWFISRPQFSICFARTPGTFLTILMFPTEN